MPKTNDHEVERSQGEGQSQSQPKANMTTSPEKVLDTNLAPETHKCSEPVSTIFIAVFI